MFRVRMVLLGDEWLQMFAESGFPPERLSAVAKHLEADREHASYAFAQLDELWQGEPSAAALCDVVHRGGRLFKQFCDALHDACAGALNEQVS